jgi:hypothetical protein
MKYVWFPVDPVKLKGVWIGRKAEVGKKLSFENSNLHIDLRV